MSNIKALDYKIESKGKLFKSWEVCHLWTLQIDKTIHKIEFITFKWSKIRKVISDSIEIFSNTKDSSNFSFTFYAASHLFTVTESSNSIHLYVDGLNFSILYKRQAGSFMEFEEKEEKFDQPLVLVQNSRGSDVSRQLKDWESKAKNFRLLSREIPTDAVREKVDIRPNLRKTAASTFIDPLSSLSPRATLAGSDTKLQISASYKSKSKKQKKKPINFFLF